MKKPSHGIVVDASTRGNPGLSKYRGIKLESGEIIFSKNIGYCTNNLSEFIALSHAVLMCLKHNSFEGITIYSDSQTAISWLKNKYANTSLAISEKTNLARDYKKRIEHALTELDIRTDGTDIYVNEFLVVSKWETYLWGEIPADYGYKK
jgi:ribonuclease HI